MEPIRIVLVDDHELARAGLRQVIESTSTMEVVGEASSFAEALSMTVSAKPDVALLDLYLGDQNGLDLIPDLRSAWPLLQVLVLTAVRDPQMHQRVVMQGANGLLLKSRAVSTLIRAIEKVHRGEVWFDRSLLADVLRERMIGADAAADTELQRIAQLSPRERQIVRLLLSGLRNREIAQSLSISEATVRNDVTSSFSKLGVSDRTELVILAHRRPELRDE